MNPKLRPIQPEVTAINGQPILVLRDPLGLSNKSVVLPQALAPLLALCDGTRDEAALRAALQVRLGIFVSPDKMSEILQRLDEAMLLDNETFRGAYMRALHAYRTAPCRPPVLAGSSYPADPGELASLMDDHLAAAPKAAIGLVARGLVSPHMDYARGGAVYGEVWGRVAASARRADIAVILGTDHQASRSRLTLTRQSYATPFGILPTDMEIVDTLSKAVGLDEAYAEELHHRSEHSIELAAVWLHHVRRGEPVPLVPILCGSLAEHLSSAHGADDTLEGAIAALRQALAGRRALIVAAGDLAHTGPAFGDPVPMGQAALAQSAQADSRLIEAISRGDARDFVAQIAAEDDRRHICGLAPIYLALRLLSPVRGEPAGYAQVPADPGQTSFVSIAGIALL